jgi:hypothetical protein
MPLKIKPQYKDTVIAFQDNGIALDKRTQKELIDLALLAHSSQDKMLMDFFELLPSVAELSRTKMQLLEV